MFSYKKRGGSSNRRIRCFVSNWTIRTRFWSSNKNNFHRERTSIATTRIEHWQRFKIVADDINFDIIETPLNGMQAYIEESVCHDAHKQTPTPAN